MKKICSKCGVLFDINMFTHDIQKKDKLYSSCKICNRRYRILVGKTKLPEKLSIGYKRCKKCKKIKETSVDFNKDKSKPDGFYSSCNDCRRRLYGRIKRPEIIIDNGGYMHEKGTHGARQHRFILENILKRKLKKEEVIHHIDGNKLNNTPSNLQIMTHSEHAKIHLKPKYGEDHPSAKLKNSQIPEITELKKHGMTYEKIGEKYNVCRKVISNIIQGKTYKIK